LRAGRGGGGVRACGAVHKLMMDKHKAYLEKTKENNGKDISPKFYNSNKKIN
jgi:hypothetical protein